LAWKIEYEAAARKQLRKLGGTPAARVIDGLEKMARLTDPRTRAKAMVDEWSGHYRFRFDDFRVIAKIEDDRIVIVVVAVGHRREVYD
jgi:mRNA interferase RelE/StbE